MFTDQETSVIQTMAMRLSREKSIEWLDAHGHGMSQATLSRVKIRVRSSSEQRKNLAGHEGLLTQHFERIDQLETILKLSWDNYHRLIPSGDDEKILGVPRAGNITAAQRILESIASIQPLLSRYYESTQGVIEFDKGNKRGPLSGQIKESEDIRGDRNIILASNDINTKS